MELPSSQDCYDSHIDYGWEVLYNALSVGQMDASLLTYRIIQDAGLKHSSNDTVAKLWP